MVADGQSLAVDNAIGRAEATVMDRCVAAILYVEGCLLKRTPGEPHLIAFRIVNLMARRRVVVAIRIEALWVLPLGRIEARRLMRRHRIAKTLVRRRPHFGEGRYASAVRRDGAEQLHDEALEGRKGVAAGLVGVALHGLLEPGAHIQGRRCL